MTDAAPKDGTTPVSTEKTEVTTPGTEPDGKSNDAKKTEDASWWDKAQKEHGFKSQDAVYESWKESSKKISEQGEKLTEAEKFQKDVAPILVALNEDPDLRDKWIAKLQNKTLADPKKDTTPVADRETRSFLEGQVVSKFEESHGISNLDEETQKDIRKEIGKYLSPSGKLTSLPDEMENALIIAMAKNDKVKNALSNKKEETTPLTDYGALPSMSSGVLPSGEIKLTEAQEKVAKNMPGGRDAYIEGLKKINNLPSKK